MKTEKTIKAETLLTKVLTSQKLLMISPKLIDETWNKRQKNPFKPFEVIFKTEQDKTPLGYIKIRRGDKTEQTLSLYDVMTIAEGKKLKKKGIKSC